MRPVIAPSDPIVALRRHAVRRAGWRTFSERVVAALIRASSIILFARVSFEALDAFPAEARQTVMLFGGEGLLTAYIGLAVWQTLRRRG